MEDAVPLQCASLFAALREQAGFFWPLTVGIPASYPLEGCAVPAKVFLVVCKTTITSRHYLSTLCQVSTTSVALHVAMAMAMALENNGPHLGTCLVPLARLEIGTRTCG